MAYLEERATYSTKLLPFVQSKTSKTETNPMSSLKKDIRRLLIEFDNTECHTDEEYLARTQKTEQAILNLIESVIPEEKEFGTGKYSDYGEGFNDCIKDIKSKLIEGEK